MGLIAPGGALVQNVGSQGDWLFEYDVRHRAVFKHVHIINVNSPEYASPYFLSLATDALDPHVVDWDWWSNLRIPTDYYHPTLHRQLFILPLETMTAYAEGGKWNPLDSEALQKRDKILKSENSNVEL